MDKDDVQRSERYLREVEHHLRDLPESARGEIIRELRAHMDDAAAAAPAYPTGSDKSDKEVTAIAAAHAEAVERFGSARRLGRSLTLASRGMTQGESMRRRGRNIVRWSLAGAALLLVIVYAALLRWGVPAATPDQLTEISGVYAGVTLPVSAEADLLIGLHDRAAFFRVNDDRVPEVATAALLTDLRPGDRIYLSVYKRFLPADTGTRGVVPVAAIRTDTKHYLPLPTEGGGAAPAYSGAFIFAALLGALCCLLPDLRLLYGKRGQLRSTT